MTLKSKTRTEAGNVVQTAASPMEKVRHYPSSILEVLIKMLKFLTLILNLEVGRYFRTRWGE